MYSQECLSSSQARWAVDLCWLRVFGGRWLWEGSEVWQGWPGPAAWLCLCQEVTGLEQLQLEGSEWAQCPPGTPTQAENVGGGKRSQINVHKIQKRAKNSKKPGFWSHGPEIIPMVRLPLWCGMFWPWCSAWTLPWWSACPCPAAFPHTARWLQSVGFQGKGRHFCWRNPILCSRTFFLFFRKRLTGLNKADRRCGRTFSGAALAGAQQKWFWLWPGTGTLPSPPMPQFAHLWKYHPAVFMFTHAVPGPHILWHSGSLSSPAVPCWPWAAEAREDLISLSAGIDLHMLVLLSYRDWQQHRWMKMSFLGVFLHEEWLWARRQSMEQRGCTRSAQHSCRWKGGHISAGQCWAGHLGEGKFVPFPAEPACCFSTVETNDCNARFLPDWHPLAKARTISLEALPSSLHAFALVLKHRWHLGLGGMATIRRENPFSLKSDNMLPAPRMENLQYYLESRDIRRRSPTGI